MKEGKRKMNNRLKNIYKVLRDNRARMKTIVWGVLCISSIIFLLSQVAINGEPSILVLSIYVLVTVIFAFHGLNYLGKSSKLKKSLITLATTGSIKYINEIINKQYETNGKVCFSEHLMFFNGATIIAYKDIVVFIPEQRIGYGRNRRIIPKSFVTTDGKRYVVNFKNSNQIIPEILQRQRHIIVNEPYKTYKEYILSLLNLKK